MNLAVGNSSGHIKVVFTLVHGTFAPRAAWTRPESLLRTRLTKLLGPAVSYTEFRWGRLNNSQSARQRAALRLRRHIIAVAATYPDHEQYIIAHSHAGNIASAAASDPLIESMVKGVVCLSTPFIHVQPRALWSSVQLGLPWMVMLPVIAITYRYLRPMLPSYNSDLWSFLLAVASLIVGGLAVYPLKLLLDWSRRQVDKIQQHHGATPLLIIRATGDEATGALVTAAFGDYVISVVLALVCLPFSIVVSCVWLVSHWTTKVLGLPEDRVGTLMLMCTTAAAVTLSPRNLQWLLMALAVAGVLVGVGIILRWLSGVGYGLTSLFVEVTSESTPIGIWTVYVVQSNKGWAYSSDWSSAGGWRDLLAHSAAYNNLDVPTIIADWVVKAARKT